MGPLRDLEAEGALGKCRNGRRSATDPGLLSGAARPGELQAARDALVDAKGLGKRAKTDPIDAQVLARMAETVDDLPLTPACSQAQRDLVELQAARDALDPGGAGAGPVEPLVEREAARKGRPT